MSENLKLISTDKSKKSIGIPQLCAFQFRGENIIPINNLK